MIEHLRELELLQWFVRAHLESATGVLSATADTEREAAGQAAAAATV